MNLLKDLRDLFTPNRCLHCKTETPRNTDFLCLDCFTKLEHLHFFDYKNNPLEKLFWGKADIMFASALYLYQKQSPIQTLLKELKYKGLQNFGKETAKTAIVELEKATHRFKSIDMVIPVPLHPKKERKRGYNQIDVFGKTIANYLNIPFEKNILLRTDNNKSQTKQNKEQRHHSVKNVFTMNLNYNQKPQHILIVDDVMTTGATLISCAQALTKFNNIKISIITIACVV